MRKSRPPMSYISFFANQGQLDANSRRVLQGVLAENPQHEGAQMLMAMGEARSSNFEQAQGWIQRAIRE